METWMATVNQNESVEAQIEPCKVGRPAIADSLNFVEEQDPYPHDVYPEP
jgi:hypothetical protein